MSMYRIFYCVLLININFRVQLKNTAHAQNQMKCSELRYILQFNTYLQLEDRNTYIEQVLGLPASSSGCNHSKKNEYAYAHFEGTVIARKPLECGWSVARQHNLVTKMNLPSDFSVISLASQTHKVIRPSAVLALLRKEFEAAKRITTVKSISVQNVVSDMRVSTINGTRKILQARSHKHRYPRGCGEAKTNSGSNYKPNAK